MADLAIGVTACLAFWQDHSFKAAAVCAASIFLLGDAVGHIREMAVAGNFAPGNAGLPFYMDIICPTLAIILVIITKHPRRLQNCELKKRYQVSGSLTVQVAGH
jgi:hypothetical protein